MLFTPKSQLQTISQRLSLLRSPDIATQAYHRQITKRTTAIQEGERSSTTTENDQPADTNTPGGKSDTQMRKQLLLVRHTRTGGSKKAVDRASYVQRLIHQKFKDLQKLLVCLYSCEKNGDGAAAFFRFIEGPESYPSFGGAELAIAMAKHRTGLSDRRASHCSSAVFLSPVLRSDNGSILLLFPLWH